MKWMAGILTLFLCTNAYALDLENTFKNMVSEDANRRDWARESMRALEPQQIPEVMGRLRAESQNYWIRSGIVVGLDVFISAKPEAAPAISAALTSDDMILLVALATDEELMVSSFAKSFLIALQDGRAVEIATAVTTMIPEGKNKKQLIRNLVEIAAAGLKNY